MKGAWFATGLTFGSLLSAMLSHVRPAPYVTIGLLAVAFILALFYLLAEEEKS